MSRGPWLKPEKVQAVRKAEGSTRAVAKRFRISQSAVQRIRKAESYQPRDLTDVRSDLLDSLMRESMTVVELVEDTGRDMTAVYDALKRMSRDKLVTRELVRGDPKRKPVSVYSITPTGKRVLQGVGR